MATKTAKQVQDILSGENVTKRNGIFTLREEFFYTHGKTEYDLIKDIKLAFPDARIIDQGEIWKPFNGGASIVNSSHWFVKFSL